MNNDSGNSKPGGEMPRREPLRRLSAATGAAAGTAAGAPATEATLDHPVQGETE